MPKLSNISNRSALPGFYRPLRGLYQFSCTEFLGSAAFSQGVRQSERSEISPRSGRRHKAWGEAQRTPGSPTQKLAEPAKRPIAVRLQNVNHDDSTVGRSAGFDYFRLAVPGVPLRFTPG